MNRIRIEDLSVGDWVCAEQLCGVHSEPRGVEMSVEEDDSAPF